VSQVQILSPRPPVPASCSNAAGCIAYSAHSEPSSPGESMISPSMSRRIVRALAAAARLRLVVIASGRSTYQRSKVIAGMPFASVNPRAAAGGELPAPSMRGASAQTEAKCAGHFTRTLSASSGTAQIGSAKQPTFTGWRAQLKASSRPKPASRQTSARACSTIG
jgi:hypothetical protein